MVEANKKVAKKKPKLSLALKRQIKKQNLHPPVLELLIVIVNRGYGEEVGSFLEKLDVNLNIISFGCGTAPSNLANLFGLYNKEKEMVFAAIDLNESESILDKLEGKFLSDAKYAAIAFTVPLKSVTNQTMEKLS